MSDGNSTVTYKDIPGFPGYRVGDDGPVWSCIRRGQGRAAAKRILTGTWTELRQGSFRGYRRIELGNRGKPCKRFVHHLVLEAFVGPRPDGMEGRHFPDPNPANNRLENLSWSTHRDNIADKAVHGTKRFGSRHQNSKLTEVAVLSIKMDIAAKVLTKREIAKKHGVDPCTITDIDKGRTWSHVTL